jgi:hypothetical protein
MLLIDVSLSISTPNEGPTSFPKLPCARTAQDEPAAMLLDEAGKGLIDVSRFDIIPVVPAVSRCRP